MTRSDLVNKLAERFTQLTQRDTEFAVKTILDAMSDALARGHRITLFTRGRRPQDWPAEVEELGLDDYRDGAALLAEWPDHAGGFAHEIRNPLTSIKTFIQLAPERKDDPEFIQEFSKIVLDDVYRIERLIQEIYAKMTAYHHKWSPTDLVIWDNRSILHRATAYDTIRYKRLKPFWIRLIWC